MRVLVAVKEVVEVADDFELEGDAIEERYREYDLNEWDDYAVEAAVQLREAGVADEVVSVTIGPQRAEETIRMALAKGVDRAVRIWDDTLEGRPLLDVGTNVRLLEPVVVDEDPDLALTGVQAGDDGWGATGVALAAEVNMAWAAVVTGLELDGDVAHVRRELEGGVEELVDVELPAVFTIQTGLNEPRYASLRGIRQAQSKEIAHHTLDDLGLSASDVAGDVTMTEMYEPETEGETRYLEGNAGEQAGVLAELLREQGVGAA